SVLYSFLIPPLEWFVGRGCGWSTPSRRSRFQLSSCPKGAIVPAPRGAFQFPKSTVGLGGWQYPYLHRRRTTTLVQLPREAERRKIRTRLRHWIWLSKRESGECLGGGPASRKGTVINS